MGAQHIDNACVTVHGTLWGNPKSIFSKPVILNK